MHTGKVDGKSRLVLLAEWSRRIPENCIVATHTGPVDAYILKISADIMYDKS